jgi:hypothetical protein
VNPLTLDIKKQIEARALDAACRAGLSVPNGEVIPGEEPDFRIENGAGLSLGIEVTELLPPPRNASFSSPVAEQRLHRDLIELAEEQYYRSTGAVAVKVTRYFWDIERRRSNKRDMAHALANFARSHAAD